MAVASDCTELPAHSFSLLTGATGTLGQELLYQLLTVRSQDHFLVLARGGGKPGGDGAVRRVRAILRKHLSGAELEAAWQRLTVLDGDVCEPQLGLSDQLYQGVAERLTQVIHCAAAVRFDQPLAEARQINLEGTRNLVRLAQLARQHGQTTRFDYVGTAYIAGKRKGVAYENELEHNRGFHNTYEQSKYETEIWLRTCQPDLPLTVYRPSIIIGNSRTGETNNFKAFYWPIRVYAMGQMRLLPAAAQCRVDLVPVDFVAAAVTALSQRSDAIGGCYHLTAGRHQLISVGEIMEAAISFFQVKPPTLIPPYLLKPAENMVGRWLLSDRTLKTLRLGEPYYPYLSLKLEFDNSQTLAALCENEIAPSDPHLFFDRLFRYCVESNWGRKQGQAVEPALPAEELLPELGTQLAHPV